jgi:hypothetical protein
MKTLSKLVIGTVAGVGIALAAVTYAHGPGGYGPGGQGYGMGMHGSGGYGYGMGMHGAGGFGPGMGMHGPGFGGPGTIDTRLDTLKSELKLTGNQTKAWGTFENAVRGEVETMLATHDAMHTNVQNQDAHIAFMEQRLEGVKAVQKTRTDLYQVLTPEQKTILDRYGWFHGARMSSR